MSSVWSSDFRSPSARLAANDASMTRFSTLVYESQAAIPLSQPDLQQLITSAEQRNRKEGVTGLLVYDKGHFIQWLEGPTEGLGRVWRSISQDRRHKRISVLGQSTTSVRLFGGSPMALGKSRVDASGGNGKRRGEGDLPSGLIDTLHQNPRAAPSVLAGLAPWATAKEHLRTQSASALMETDRLSLRAVVDTAVIPELLARHAKQLLAPLVIDPRAAELAGLLVSAGPEAALALIDQLRADGRSITHLCAGLLEPTARALGDLWTSDDCSEFEVARGLGHLETALRHVSFETSPVEVPALSLSMPHSVLVAPSPREPHMLGSAIASELFWRAGWDVRCEFPDSDEALSKLVHDCWFDVLDLSLSGAFTREHRLPAMAASIRAAHANSRNPALVVVVDGRVFHDHLHTGVDAGVSASSASALDLVSTATRQIRQSQ